MKSRTPLILLCGGRSRRMGQAKHQLEVKGTTLWELLKTRFENAGFEVLISCNKNQVDDFGNIPLIVDSIENTGPMSGIIAALAQTKSKQVVVLSCDTPLVKPESIKMLVSFAQLDKIAVCAKKPQSKFPEPTVAVWRQSSLPILQTAAMRGQYSLIQVLKTSSYSSIEISSEELQNANNPAEWANTKKQLLSGK